MTRQRTIRFNVRSLIPKWPACLSSGSQSRTVFNWLAIDALVMAMAASSASGQATWSDPGSSQFSGVVQASYETSVAEGPGCLCAVKTCLEPPNDPTGNPPEVNGWIPGWLGSSFGRSAEEFGCHENNNPCSGCPNWGSRPIVQAWVNGIGTSTVEVTGSAYVWNNRSCDCSFSDPAGQFIHGIAELNTTVDLLVNAPVGQTVDVNFSWFALVNRETTHEGAGEDPTGVVDIEFTIAVNGNVVASPIPLGSADINSNPATPNGTLFLPGPAGQPIGTLSVQAGDVISIHMQADVEAEITSGNPADHWDDFRDRSWASYYGKVVLSIDQPVPSFNNPAIPGNSVNEFSLKIGSDAEMSDPGFDPTNRNEVFDPGDMYPWHGAPLPACGASGIRDDVMAFGVDYWPQAPDCIVDPLLGGTAAETCSVPFGSFSNSITVDRFDLDGSDALDVELRFLIPPTQPLAAPIGAFVSNCIYGPDPYLLISFADDMPSHYAVDFCQVPSRSPSSSSDTYGTSSGRDEVMMLTTNANPIQPYQVDFVGPIPVFSEADLHPNLAPNPNPANPFDPLEQRDDNDVNALDVNVNPNVSCDHWYISADKEATGVDATGLALDPASIYEVLPLGGITKVIDGAIHLGLPPGTDVNAFEFVWLRYCNDPNDPTNCQIVLGLLFSVDEDDGFGVLDLMPGSESGGLDPRKIYASYLTGSHFEYSPDSLDDNVNAIAASPMPFVTSNFIIEPEPCGTDLNGGCNSTPPSFTSITCGETVFGTAWADGGIRDTDWYRINHPGGLLEWTVNPDFNAAAFIIEAHCNNPAILAAAFGGSPTTVSAVLPAGDYYLFVAVDGFQSPACGSGQNNYTAEATCIPASGPPNEFCANPDPLPFNTPVSVDSTNAATDGPHEFSHCGFTGQQDADVWYEFIAGCDKTYTFELQAAPGSAPDRIMGIYLGGCPTQPDTVDACGDTFTGDLSMSMNLIAGETVLIRVGTPGGFPAQSVLKVTGPTCPFDLNDDCVVNVVDLLQMLGQWGQPYQIPHLLQLLGAWGPCP